MPEQDVYIASNADDAGGLHVFDLTTGNGGPGMAHGTVTSLDDAASYLAAHPGGEYLYVVHEVSEGAVTALRRDPDEGLVRLNRVSSGAAGPCHCSVHPSGEYLFVAHYTGSAVSVLPVADDGRLSAPVQTVGHEGSSVDPERQTAAHPHSMTPGPDGRYLYVPDLGTDEIVVYGFDEGTGALSRVGAAATRAGAGPRHLAFHPDEPLVYVVNELDSTLSTFERDPSSGELSHAGTVETVPDGYEGENYPSDVHVHPSGRWVYASNRGHDSVVAFGVEGEHGGLAALGHAPTGGHWPRTFGLDASGQYILVANRRSDDVGVLRVDGATGRVESTGQVVPVPEPMCVCSLPRR